MRRQLTISSGVNRSACGSASRRPGEASHGGDERGGGEEDAHSQLFGHAVVLAGDAGIAIDVDQDEVAEENPGEDQVQVKGIRWKLRHQQRKSQRCARDDVPEDSTVAMMKEVPLFNLRWIVPMVA